MAYGRACHGVDWRGNKGNADFQLYDFLYMGGHGLYVWTAYGVSFLLLLGCLLYPLGALRRMRRSHSRRSAGGEG